MTIRDQEQKQDTGRAESGNMEYKPYQQVMADLAKQTPAPLPTATVKPQPVNMPGVMNQTNNLMRPVNTEELYKGRDK